MDNEELLEMLEAHGVHAEVFNVPVPVINSRILCGPPRETWNFVADDFYLVPKKVVGSHPHVFLPVEGDSMIGAGMHDGDMVMVELYQTANEGDDVSGAGEGGARRTMVGR